MFKPYLKTSLNQAISLTEAMFMASSTVNYQLFYPFMKSTLGKNKSILGLIMTALCKLRYLCTLGSGIWLLNLLIFFPEAIFLFKWVHFWIFFSLVYLNIKGGYIYSCLLFLTNVNRLHWFHSLCQFRTLEKARWVNLSVMKLISYWEPSTSPTIDLFLRTELLTKSLTVWPTVEKYSIQKWELQRKNGP